MPTHTVKRTRPVVRRCLSLLATLAFMGLPLYAPGAAASQSEDPAVSAPQERSVEGVLARHYEALGGDRHQQVDSMRMDGRSILMGMESAYTRYSKRPDKVLLEIYVQGMTGVQAFDGEVAWAYMPFMGQSAPATLSGTEARAVIEGADFDGPLVHAKQKGHDVKLLGSDTVNDRQVHVLEVNLSTGGVQTHYVDMETFYVLRVVSSEGQADFLDFRMFDGHPVPTVIEMTGPMGEQTIYVDQVEFNVDIDDAAFSMQ